MYYAPDQSELAPTQQTLFNCILVSYAAMVVSYGLTIHKDIQNLVRTNCLAYLLSCLVSTYFPYLSTSNIFSLTYVVTSLLGSVSKEAGLQHM
jgi:hypothetical protein